MPHYRYRALNAEGQLTTGACLADNPQRLHALLMQRQLRPIRVRRCYAWTTQASVLSLEQQQLLAYEWSMLLRSGLALVDMLQADTDRPNSPRGTLAQHLLQALQAGQGLSEALQQSGCVQRRFVTAVRAGEKSGQLPECLFQLSQLLEAQQRVRQTLQQALIYPVISALVMLAVSAYLMTSLVPQLQGFLTDLGIALPWYTHALIVSSEALSQYGGVVVLLLGVGVMGVGLLRRCHAGFACALDARYLQLPVLGSLRADAEYALLWRQLGLLYQAGLNWLDNFEQAIEACGNRALCQQLGRSVQALQQGQPLSQAVTALDTLNTSERRLIQTAEASGTLGQVMSALAQRRQQALEQGLARSLALVQPAMMLGLGALMVWLVLSVFVPLYSLTDLSGAGS